MNDVKNVVIAFLSFLILIQSLFLVYLLKQRRPSAVAKSVRAERAPQEEVRRPPLAVEEKEAAAGVRPVVQEKPAPALPSPPFSARIAVVLDDWGYNLKNKDFITGNDFRVTVAILPFRAYSAQIAELAKLHRKDILIHMPMEPDHKENYGLEEKTIMTNMDKKRILDLLEDARAAVPYAVGINNHMGSKATADPRLMRIVFDYLKGRGLFFLDSFVTPRSICATLAKKAGIDFFQRDIFIDNEDDADHIRTQVLKLAAKARRSGLAVGIGHDRPTTVAVLDEMIPKLEREGYQFIGMTEAVRDLRGSD